MRIGFFGTPQLSSDCLEKLLNEHEIVFIVTAEDKPRGRNKRVTSSAAKKFAIHRGIDIFQPCSLSDPEFIKKIKKYNADIFVVVAYGKIIPDVVYELPPLKTINLHPSLLPQYRGAAPVQWALINGESKTGITVQVINSELDAGDIVVQKELHIDKDLTAGELFDIVTNESGDLLNEAISSLARGYAELTPQDHNRATYCGKITRDTAHINWEKDADSIHNLVRGLNPKPAAWTTFRNNNLKLWNTSPFNEDIDLQLKPGALYKYKKKRLIAGTGKGLLEILRLQPENKKIMDSLSFINGYRLAENDFFV